MESLPAHNENVNVLLVEDQAENLLAVHATLQNPLYNLVTAQSGFQALKHLLAMDFAVIVLDAQMPGMDGFETARLIHGRERSQHTPIIFLTAAYETESDIFKAYQVGAVDYISKPFVPEILRSKVAA